MVDSRQPDRAEASDETGAQAANAAKDAEQLVVLEDIWKSYGGIAVLKGVNLDLKAGEIHALLGGNGAGKSTLMKILTGVASSGDGKIFVRGEQVTHLTPRTAHAHGIYLVPQEPELFGNLSVLENIQLTLEHTSVSTTEIRDVVSNLSSSIDLSANASDLSISEQQLVEIARGVLIGAKVLIVDEPTSALTAREAESLFDVLRDLAYLGVGIFYVSHRMSEIFALCNRLTVLRDGVVALQAPVADVTLDEVVTAMVPDRAAQSSLESMRRTPDLTGIDPALVVNGLSGNGFTDISLELYPGEVLGMAGIVGSGRTEFAETVFGLRRGLGEVTLCGERYDDRSPRASLKRGLSYVPEDRHEHGVFLAGSIVDNVTSTVLTKVSRYGLLSSAKESEMTDRVTDELALQKGARSRLVQNLSGGNQQKVSLAKAIAGGPRVLILDEPSRGIDVAARADLYRIIDALAAKGLAVLMISSDFEEVALLSSRVVIMAEGRVATQLEGDDVTFEHVRDASFGTIKKATAA